MASPKITKQGASFPEDEPGTPKVLPGDGGDRSARIQRAEAAEAAERPGEQGDRFATFNQGERVESGENQPEQPGTDQVEDRHAVPGNEGEQVAEQDPDRRPAHELSDDRRVTPETYEGEGWSRDALQSEAAKRNLATSGTKPELAERLRADDRATAGDAEG